MIPVEQTITAEGQGNCFAACLASILELPIDRLPNFHGGYWIYRWQDWLSPANLSIQRMSADNATYGPPRGYAILSAASPRIDGVNHAVVLKDGAIVWDPHPERVMGVGVSVAWYVLHPLDPLQPVALDALAVPL